MRSRFEVRDFENLKDSLPSWITDHLEEGSSSFMTDEVNQSPDSPREDSPTPEDVPIIIVPPLIEKEINIMTLDELDLLRESYSFPPHEGGCHTTRAQEENSGDEILQRGELRTHSSEEAWGRHLGQSKRRFGSQSLFSGESLCCQEDRKWGDPTCRLEEETRVRVLRGCVGQGSIGGVSPSTRLGYVFGGRGVMLLEAGQRSRVPTGRGSNSRAVSH
ncbi:hypothetical protein Acr_04g0004560 [Actinidia rufa]|uniref:Uncharacterized protein n=1 Tax=Actinidia rufa TaxID=165716 RepID=A0A7J0EGV3_9ERIC|nr:hypothetical protein Acr_04g0004560 [Actinidia rufa]